MKLTFIMALGLVQGAQIKRFNVVQVVVFAELNLNKILGPRNELIIVAISASKLDKLYQALVHSFQMIENVVDAIFALRLGDIDFFVTV